MVDGYVPFDVLYLALETLLFAGLVHLGRIVLGQQQRESSPFLYVELSVSRQASAFADWTPLHFSGFDVDSYACRTGRVVAANFLRRAVLGLVALDWR